MLFENVSHCSQILRCWRMCSGWSAIRPTGLRTHVSCVDASLPHATWLVKTPLRTPATEPKTSLLRSAGQWMTWHLVHFLMFLLKRSLWCSPRLHLFDWNYCKTVILSNIITIKRTVFYFNKMSFIFCDGKAEFSAAITPVFSFCCLIFLWKLWYTTIQKFGLKKVN